MPQTDDRVVRARHLRRHATEPEKRLWQHLRTLKSDGSHFRRQATIGKYFADFACHKKRLVIELDGDTHTMPAAISHDEVRTRYLQSQGYRVLRFWNNDVMQNIDAVIAQIARTLEEPPPPTPPRRALRGGRGAKESAS